MLFCSTTVTPRCLASGLPASKLALQACKPTLQAVEGCYGAPTPQMPRPALKLPDLHTKSYLCLFIFKQIVFLFYLK